MGFYILIFIILLSVVYLLIGPNKTANKNLPYSEMRMLFEENKVKSFYIDDNVVYMELYSEYEGSKKVTSKLYSVAIFYNDLSETITEQRRNGTLEEYDLLPVRETPWWVALLPYLLVIGLFLLFWYIMINRTGAGGEKNVMRFGKARTRLANDEKNKVTFNDVAGADEEKEELQEIVDFLKNPKKYIDLGARIPKGVLLVGPPGTGKTLLAKAVAGEAGVSFLSISGSDFVELYVGIGASRVRDLFDQAKKASPAIIFIDEIDAVGRQRGSGLGGGHDEREQTLNQLLVEMDGFSPNEGVIVMAATNRADILDNALLRPGRFDRQVYVGLPDIKGREAILKIHARNKALGEDVNLNSIAKGTVGFTGADLENLMNEAALLAARRSKKFITMAEMDEAILKVIAGPEKKSRVISEKERKLTAYHEAGHAVISHYLEHVDPVHQITILPRGGAGGMTITRPTEDKNYKSKQNMFEDIIVYMGGRIAEELMLDDISTGASSDIRQASAIARAMVTKYGMSEKLGPISYDSSDHSVFIGRDFAQTKSYSEKVAAEIDDEVKRIFDEAYSKGREILKEHSDILVATAEYLLLHETMDGELFDYICKNGGQLPPEGALPEEPAIMDDIRREALEDAKMQELLEKEGEAVTQPETDAPDSRRDE
ncbi:MAG: ATP-dependent zinc metalloprotease FtsH [Oscillospiraceae bacterium]|nr:ATP-dependent zinc metalloprotease FtsH [Oscillospiraceae bacterium]